MAVYLKNVPVNHKRGIMSIHPLLKYTGGFPLESNMSMDIWPNIKSIKFSENCLTLNRSCKNDQYIFFVTTALTLQVKKNNKHSVNILA